MIKDYSKEELVSILEIIDKSLGGFIDKAEKSAEEYANKILAGHKDGCRFSYITGYLENGIEYELERLSKAK